MVHNMNLIYEISNNKIEKTKQENDKLLENYISSSIQLNSIFEKTTISEKIIEKKSKKEILMIGKFSTFKNRMDTSYYELLKHIQEISDYKIVFVDSKSCEINKPLSYYIDKYCETSDPIIYNIVYTDKSEQIINDLVDSKLIKIYEIEDCYEVDNLIYNINTFKYDYVIYRYNCEQMNYIISKCDSKFIHYPHYINTNIFRQYNNEKSIDILLYGNTSNFYPFRQRLFNLIKKSGLNYYYLPHPGYNEFLNEDNPNKIVGSELSQLINKTKITISTCSSFNYLLKKYIEISLSGSIIAGNYPTTEENKYKNCMCLLDETDTDEVIIEKIKNILNLSKEDYNNIIRDSYKISIENYSYNQGVERFNKIINYIYKNNINNTNIINNETENNKIFSYIYDNNIWNNGKGGSGEGSSIENNIKTYIPFLKDFIKKNNIKKVVDLGCGDWQSSNLIYDNLDVNYTGYDIYEKIIKVNKNKYPQYKFIHLDFIHNTNILENGDLCIIKDVLQHLCNKDINNLLEYLVNSKKYKYIMICNCCNQTNDNQDINNGEWRPLSSSKKPLNNYNATIIYEYFTKEVSLISL